ncbi:MAG TPA: hypothetical protein VNV87_01085 [Acidimicrobiales bacterium]|jgi:hypothetical protein|nr:hypothetical protein [Acidimicrobiales bacterium]
MSATSPPDPEYAFFARTVGHRFSVPTAAGSTVELELTALTGDPPSPSEPSSFSVFFLGPAADPLAQGTYELTHQAEGMHPVFIVPVGREGDSIRYEAVFTRLGTP